jgi:hypothetical protein
MLGTVLSVLLFAACNDENKAPEIQSALPFADTTIHVGSELLFSTEIVSDVPFEYKWFINDEFKSSETVFLFTPVVSGEYTIKLVVSNKIGTDSIEALIHVLPRVHTIDFENLSLGITGYWNGSDGTGKYTSGVATFTNTFNSDWQYWEGFAYSNINDTVNASSDNMYSVFDSSNKGNKFGVFYYSAFNPSFVTLNSEKPLRLISMKICNTTYAALSMLNGDTFAKKFGGATGADPDFFKIVITGLDKNDQVKGKIEAFLADYRDADNAKDYLLKKWHEVDLSGLGEVHKLFFTLVSSDNGAWGMNTPGYFAFDDLRYYDPE